MSMLKATATSEVKSVSIYSNHGFGGYSSYPVVARYIGSKILSGERKEPKNLVERSFGKVLRSLALSEWYRATSLALEWSLFNYLLRNKVNLIHFLWAERDLGYSDLILKYFSIPIFATFHCCPEDLPKIIKYPDRLKYLSKIIIMSETQREFFESCGVAPHRIQCVLHGVDTDFFKPSIELNLTDRENSSFTVLSVGNYKRNFKLLKSIAQKLEKEHYNINIQIVTSQSKASYFEELNNVEVLTALTDQELQATYRRASCLLLVVENATANNALLEGMSSGLPIVAENLGGIPEYVNSECSILSPPSDLEILVQSIIDLYHNPLKLKAMSIASRKRALELSWLKVGGRTKKLYDQALRKEDK